MSLAKITVEARLATDIKTAWDTYTNPEHIINWNFAADDWCCPSASNDMRVGGKYSARMEAKDGSFGFDFEATYDEVIDGQQFTYTMPDGRVVTTKFEEAGGETKVTTTFDPESQNPIEMQQSGWQAILNNYVKYTEGL